MLSIVSEKIVSRRVQALVEQSRYRTKLMVVEGLMVDNYSRADDTVRWLKPMFSIQYPRNRYHRRACRECGRGLVWERLLWARDIGGASPNYGPRAWARLHIPRQHHLEAPHRTPNTPLPYRPASTNLDPNHRPPNEPHRNVTSTLEVASPSPMV